LNSSYSYTERDGKAVIRENPPRTQPLEEQLENFASAGATAQRAADEVIKKQIQSKIEAVSEATSTGVTPVQAEAGVREKWLKYKFINATAVHTFLLEQAASTRSHKFTRVSEETLTAVNEAVRQFCVSHVKRMPSKGKTL